MFLPKSILVGLNDSIFFKKEFNFFKSYFSKTFDKHGSTEMGR